MLKSLGLLMAATIAVCNSSSAIASAKWKQQISQVITAELSNSGTPSLQVAIGKDNKVVYKSAFGLSDIENNVLANNDSKYRIGSISKWFTATAARSLIDKGALDPNAAIQVYCPQFPKKRWPITSNHLLTHRSGIRHYIDYQTKLDETTDPQERELIQRNRDRDFIASVTRYVDVVSPLDSFKDDPLRHEPGQYWLYSSPAYRVLACVIEGASKMSYSQAMSELVFAKAKMTDTLKDDAWHIIPHRTTGYRLDRKKTLRRADFRDTSENLPAGGHLSTATDLVIFAMALNSGKFFSLKQHKKSWVTTSRKTIGVKPSWRNAIPSEEYYGTGEMYFPDQTRLWVGHTGRIAGGAAIVALQPESNLSIAITTNAKGWNGYIRLLDQLKMILEESNELLQ